MNEVLDAARADGVVIVGGGQAGGRAAEALRAAGFEGAVRIIGEEAETPYERPSLSKEMLLNPQQETIARVLPQARYEELGIGLTLGVPVTSLDRTRRQVLLADGSSYKYGALIIATGARVRELTVSGADTGACQYLRTIEDSRNIRNRLRPDVRLLIIGAGFIGLEVAAAARQRGAKVLVADVASQVLGRVAPAELGEFYKAYHESRGVEIRLGITLSAIERRSAGLTACFADGTEWQADLIVAGIGVIPNAELAADAGLEVQRGIVVDEFGATADPHIMAAGDVAAAWHPVLGRRILLESWQNAQNQAIKAARNLARPEERAPHADVPWFWSDQFDLNLQIVGLPSADCRYVRRGSPASRGWMLFAMQGERVTGAFAINAARDLRAARELIAARAVLADAVLAAPETNLSELVHNARTALR